jgi:hypothetical protein
MVRQISTAEEGDTEETQVNSGLEQLYLRSAAKKPLAFVFFLKLAVQVLFSTKVAHESWFLCLRVRHAKLLRSI